MPARPGYACRECDYRSGKWLGRCPACEAWDTLEPLDKATAGSARSEPARAVPFPEIASVEVRRMSSGIAEFDRVLGGGLVPGAVVLVGGEPGIGKSTLLLQAASAIAEAGHGVLYVSGEESAGQLHMRGTRLGVRSPRLRVVAETDVASVIAAARETAPALIVVDSVQAVRCADVASLPGSVAQVRESAGRFVELAKARDIPVLLVGHVTKDGAIAGPRMLEHVVDVVVQFEGDRHHAHRVLRALKNRFGPADELGVFRMTDSGLAGVPNPSELFLAERPENAPGSAVHAAIEGTRPLLVEIQALVGEPVQGSPRRTTLGFDGNRLAMLLAVLQLRAELRLADRDVFVNVTGALSLTEPGADLAVAAAVISSATQRPIPGDWAFFGEIGLTGEIRAVSRGDQRVREAARLGFFSVVLPEGTALEGGPVDAVEPRRVRRLGDVVRALERAVRV